MGNLKDLNVDWNAVKTTSFQPLPVGTYGAIVTKASISETKAKNGSYIKLEIDLLGGAGVKGRKLFEYCMISHTNPKAVDAGLGKLKRLGDSIGIDFDSIEDTSELQGIPVGVKLKIESSDEYGEQNRIVTFLDFDESFLEAGSEASGF